MFAPCELPKFGSLILAFSPAADRAFYIIDEALQNG